MAAGLTTESLRRAAARLAEGMKQAAPGLNELDGALGDGDLGITMARGTERLAAEAASFPDDVGMALLQCAQVFTKSAASTYGTLFATGLMAAARATRGRPEVPWSELPSILEAAIEAMSKRGKGSLGDKTVLDAVEAVRQGVAGLDDPAAALSKAAVRAVQDALGRLRDQPFKQGRARIFGAKGIGLDDPGMVAFLRVLESLA